MLQDPPLLEIKREWERLGDDLLARFEGAQTGHLVDAMHGRGAMTPMIKPVLGQQPKFIGYAFPVATGANDNLALIAGIARAKAGDVMIVDADGFEGSAVCGDIVALLAKNAGCHGIVIDGCARDLDGLESVNLPVFARTITANSCVKSGPGRVGLPITAGGVRVQAGDLVMGDRDGVVVVAKAQVGDIADQVAAIRAAEAKVIESVEAGLTTLPFMDDLLNSDRVKFVD